jgi:hypothetical protein
MLDNVMGNSMLCRAYDPPPEPPPEVLTPRPPKSPSFGIVDFPPACPPVPLPSFEHGAFSCDIPDLVATVHDQSICIDKDVSDFVMEGYAAMCSNDREWSVSENN